MTDYITIPLSKTGKKFAGLYEAKISPEDAILMELNWNIRLNHRNTYAVHNTLINGKRRPVALHRVIMERILGRPLTKDEQVDHADNNGLNNQRHNLRLATRSQNQANSSKRIDNKSGYKGVYWKADKKKWHVQVHFNGKKKHVGYFDDPFIAHLAWRKAADELHQDFANYGE